MRGHTRLVPALLLCVLGACAASAARMPSAAMPTAQMVGAEEAPAPLDRSLFARTPQGALDEDSLQKVLAAPLELDLPARIGVMPIVAPADWRGPSPDHAIPAALAPFCRALLGDEHFTLVSELMPIPSGALGMEALRELAARYRLRYVVLYREILHRQMRSNAWTWGYLTVLGALFLPGETLTVEGVVEASLLDVKTGLLLFTVREPIFVSRTANVWHNDDKIVALERRATVAAAPRLAAEVRRATADLVASLAPEPEPTAARD
jgi:hypothetical protein